MLAAQRRDLKVRQDAAGLQPERCYQNFKNSWLKFLLGFKPQYVHTMYLPETRFLL